MDPVSIVVSALSLAGFCGKVVEQVAVFVYAANEQQDTITGFHKNISHLHWALSHIAAVLEQFPPPSESEQFELKHLCKIGGILDSCGATLRTLQSRLPELAQPGTSTPFIKRARDTLVLRLKDEVIKASWAQVNSYAQVLQLSISTLSLSSSWRAAKSQAEIQKQIRQLTDGMRSCGLATEWDESKMSPEIRQWRDSANDVAEAVYLRRPAPRRKTIPESTAAGGFGQASLSPSMPRVLSLPVVAGTAGLPSFECVEHLGRDVVEYSFNANQKMVAQLTDCGLFVKAAQYQERGMQWRETLASKYGVPFSLNDRDGMKERLVEILMSCGSKQGMLRARVIMKGIFDEEKEREEDDEDEDEDEDEDGDGAKRTERSCRRYHLLGKINVELGYLDEAKAYLEQAFGGWRRLDPVPTELVKESTRLLIEVCVQLGAIDQADGLTHWMQEQLADEPKASSELNFTRGLEWCQKRLFNIDRDAFNFDMYDDDQRTTPVHAAIAENDAEMLRLMLDCLRGRLAGLEAACAAQRLDYPVIAATKTHSEALLKLLLAAGATVDCTDSDGYTALHRCQSNKGGVGCARLVVAACARLVDETDHSGKTALFMAVEMGNEDMVRFLLAEAGANANIAHSAPPMSARPSIDFQSPLVAAIRTVCGQWGGHKDNVKRMIAIVTLLLDHGADPDARDMDGRNAVQWAREAGLARGIILKLIQSPRTTRRVSDGSTSTFGTGLAQTAGVAAVVAAGVIVGDGPDERRESNMSGPTIVGTRTDSRACVTQTRIRVQTQVQTQVQTETRTTNAEGGEGKVKWWKVAWGPKEEQIALGKS